MIKITMFSSSQKVAGQGVGSAYTELMQLLNTSLSQNFQINVNDFAHASDISHYHTVDPQFYASTFMKNRGRKIGYVHFLPETLQGSLRIPKIAQGLVSKYIISFYQRMDHLIVVNPSFIPKLAQHGIDPQKVTYIPNFVSNMEFYRFSDKKRNQVRAKLGLAPDDFMVFGDGQVQKRKGIDDFYRLAVENPSVQFIWAGGFSFGAITDGYDRYKQMIRQAPKNLTFTDIIPRAQLNEYLNAADLFLLPSYDELFPMSVLEAFNTGTPVMLRDLDLYQAIIADKYRPARDYAAMNQALRELQHDPEQLATLAQKAISAAHYYSQEHLSQIWHDFYLDQFQQMRND